MGNRFTAYILGRRRQGDQEEVRIRLFNPDGTPFSGGGETGPAGPQGPKGDTGSQGAKGDTGSFGAGSWLTNLIAPAHPALFGFAQALAANRIAGARCIVPSTGVIRDMHVWIGTKSGNCRGSIYDTNGANRTRLWTGGIVSPPSGNAWCPLGDPGIPVTAGQAIDLAVSADNATMTFANNQGYVNPGVSLMPANFIPGSGSAVPRLSWLYSASDINHPDPLAEASMTSPFNVLLLIARVAAS